MSPAKKGFLRTRATLLERLKNWADQTSWQEFFDLYSNLIYGVARKAGLTDPEAQDALQETMLAAAKHLPKFEYDPAHGSFKNWLLRMTRWRIVDQFRKRHGVPLKTEVTEGGKSRTTELAERIADPAASVDSIWEAEWQASLLQSAIQRVRRQMDPEKFQVFDLYVNKEWTPAKVAQVMGISVNQVYLAKTRITQLISEEVQRLERGNIGSSLAKR